MPSYGGTVDRRSLVSVQSHSRRWPLLRKPSRVHVSGHSRGWPITGERIRPPTEPKVISKVPERPSAPTRPNRAEIRNEAIEKPWTVSLETYLAVNDAPIGGIMLDVSPTQYALMSKAEKRRLDVRRHQESDTRAFYKREWEKGIINAYENGKITYEDVKSVRSSGWADMSPASVIIGYDSRKAAAFKEGAEKYRRVHSIREIHEGDNLRHLAYGDVTVTKVSDKSVRVRSKGWDPGETSKIDAKLISHGALRWPENAEYKLIGERRYHSERYSQKSSAELMARTISSEKPSEVVQDPEGYWWIERET